MMDQAGTTQPHELARVKKILCTAYPQNHQINALQPTKSYDYTHAHTHARHPSWGYTLPLWLESIKMTEKVILLTT